MNLLVICLLAVASMSMLPAQVDGGAPATDVGAAMAPPAAGESEIWQEDDREVLIRNVRGAKNKDAQTGSASGKKGNNSHRRGQNRATSPSKEPHSGRGLHAHPKKITSTPTHDQNRKEPTHIV